MADNTIDTLMLEVESNAEKSADGLDRLAASLAKIGKSVSGAASPLSSFASSIKEATTAINSLGSTREISSLLSQLTQLSKVRLDNLESKKIKIDLGLNGNEAKNLSQVADGIKNVANSMKLMSDINLKDTGIGTVINSLKRLSEVNTTNFNADGIANIAGALGSLNNVNFKDTGIGSVVKSLQSLSEVDTTRFDADGIARVSNALGTLGNINFKGTGLNSVIKALRELSSVDMSNFNTDSFSGIVQSISSLGQIPDISAGINKLVASLAKLAGSGASITTVAQQLPALGNALRDVVSRLASAEDVSAAVNVFVQSLARLAGAGAKTAETAAGLETLGQATLGFFRTMQSAPQISENTLRMTEALSRLAASGANVGQATNATAGAFSSLGNASSRAANITSKAFGTLGKIFQDSANLIIKSVENIISAVKTMGNIAGKSFSGMLNVTKSVATGILSSAKSIVSSFALIGNSGKVFGKVESQLKSIIRTALPFATVFGAINLAKQSVELSSSLTEVQNVVRTTFGDMTQEVNDFAKSAIQDLGMSELTFKQVASRYQAMGTSMGITSGQVQKATQFLQKNSEMYGKTADSMGDMSIELTRLAADMASFYDVAQEDVAQDLESIFTGQTRPLRQYGLDLTEATLAEWALKNGIDADMDSMSQAQKTLLRYQYVLSQTGSAQGDFLKTANTWHNMTTVLSQSFQQLGSIVGEVLINAFKPFVAALNSVMGHVITFARTVADALGKIFGWSLEIDAGGVTNDMEDVTGYYEDAGDAAGDVADGTGDAAKAAKKLKKQLAVLPFDELNQLAKDMEYAAEAGKGSGGGNGLDSLVTPETSGFSAKFVKGDGLLDQYKSDIESLYDLGEYIGDALTETLGKINWDKIYESASGFGSGLASFLNGLISPELFSELGGTIASALNTVLHALDSFGSTFDWTNFGVSLATGIKTFLSTYDWDLRVETFNTFANGILDAALAALGSVSAEDWKKIPQKIAQMVSDSDVSGISWKLGKVANSLANALYLVVSDKATWTKLGKQLAIGINNFFSGMDSIDVNTGMNGWEAIGQYITDSFSGILTSITTALQGIKWEKVGQAIADLIGSINFGEITWNFGKLANSLANALFEVISNKTTWVNLGKALSDGLKNFFRSMNTVNADTGLTGWQALGKSITTSMSGIVTAISTALGGIGFAEIGEALTNLWDSLSPFAESVGQGLVDFLHEVLEVGEDFLKNTLPNGLNSLADALDKISPEDAEAIGRGLGNVAEGLFAFMGISSVASIISNIAKGLSGFTGLMSAGWLGFATGLGAVVFALDRFGIIDVDWSALWSGLGKVKDVLVEFIEKIKWSNITEGLGHLWNAFEPFAQGFAKGLTEALDILINDIGAPLINGLGAAFKLLAKGLDAIPEGILKTIGEGLGLIAGALVSIKLAKGAITAITNLFTFLSGSSVATATATSAVGKKLASGIASSLSTSLISKASIIGTAISLTLGLAFAQVKVNEITGGPEKLAKNIAEWFGDKFVNAAQSKPVLDGVNALRDTIKKVFSFTGKDITDNTNDSQPEIEISVKVEDNTQDGVGKVKANIETLPNETAININAKDNTSTPVSMAKTNISSLPSETAVDLNANDNTFKPTESAKKNIDSLPNETSVELNAKDNASQVFKDADTNINTATANIEKNITTRTKSADTLSTTNFNNIAKKATSAFGTVKKESDEKWSSSKESVTGALSTIDTETKDKMNSVMTLIQLKWAAVLRNTNQIWEKASSKVATETGNMETSVGNAVSNILSVFTDKEQDFEDAGSALVNSLFSGMTSLSSYDISWKLSSLSRNIKKAFNFDKSMYTNGENAINSFINGLKSVKIPVPKLTFTTKSWVDKYNTGHTETSGSVGWQYLAKGGLITGLTNAILGENGRKEAVLPLESPRAMKAISAGLLSGMQSLPISQYRLADTDSMAVKPDFSKYMQRDAAQMRNTQIDNTELMDAITGAVVTAMMNNQQNPINVTCYAELKTENDEVLARAVTRGQKSLDYRYNPTPKFGY